MSHWYGQVLAFEDQNQAQKSAAAVIVFFEIVEIIVYLGALHCQPVR
jgi:hypothetical protein